MGGIGGDGSLEVDGERREGMGGEEREKVGEEWGVGPGCPNQARHTLRFECPSSQVAGHIYQ